MRCPFCGSREDKVLDSREATEGDSVRRRRECKECGRRFTTKEQIEEVTLYIIKSDGKREPFSREKVLRGIQLACTGRHISQERLDETATTIERLLHNRLEREIPSRQVGDMVMEQLRALDHVAYVRFASVYKQFEDATQFRDIANMLRRKTRP